MLIYDNVMILTIWVGIGLMLNFVTITRVISNYYQKDMSIPFPIAFYVNFLFAPLILFFNLYLVAIKENNQIVKN